MGRLSSVVPMAMIALLEPVSLQYGHSLKHSHCLGVGI